MPLKKRGKYGAGHNGYSMGYGNPYGHRMGHIESSAGSLSMSGSAASAPSPTCSGQPDGDPRAWGAHGAGMGEAGGVVQGPSAFRVSQRPGRLGHRPAPLARASR